MIEVDPATLECPWHLAIGDAPADIYPTITFRNGQVIQEGTRSVPFTIRGTELSFTRHDVGEDGAEWVTTYTFELPAPLATGEPGLFGTELVRPDGLPGTIATVEKSDIGEGIEFATPCALRRVT